FGLFLSTTWRDMYAHIMKNERQGKPTPCAVVIGCDPPVPLTSVARIRGDELGVAGALRGAPLEVVRCETNDLEVPAHAEIVIEGFVPAGVREHEGPFGEYTGYMGSSGPSFVIEVTAITHRTDPIYQAFFSQMPPSESSCIRGTGRDVALLKHLKRDLRLPVRDVQAHLPCPLGASPGGSGPGGRALGRLRAAVATREGNDRERTPCRRAWEEGNEATALDCRADPDRSALDCGDGAGARGQARA